MKGKLIVGAVTVAVFLVLAIVNLVPMSVPPAPVDCPAEYVVAGRTYGGCQALYDQRNRPIDAVQAQENAMTKEQVAERNKAMHESLSK